MNATEEQRDERLDRLEAFVGEWRLEAPAFPLPPEFADAARTTFEWTLDGSFDSRGIARLYAMSFDGREWTLERHAADFSPLDFHQRWLGTFGSGGDTIEGRWESSPDGHDWELDFELAYHRLRQR